MPTNRHTPRAASRPSGKHQVLAIARRAGVLRSRDLAAYGLSREVLRRLVADGQIERRSRGLYVVTGSPVTEHETLAAVAARVPRGVVCLLSALRLHGLTTQEPPEVWIAIGRKARVPREPELPIHVVHFSGAAFTSGIETRQAGGVTIRVYGPAKTVADCFKYRRKIGLDIALEALREYLRVHRGGVDTLWHYAAICRATNVMRPYLEAMVAS